MRRGEKPAKAKVRAKRPARKPRKSDASKLRLLETRLAEVLEREKATDEILRVIGISSTDVQPVFATVAETAARLCKASDVSIFRRDGDRLRRVAHHGSIPAGVIGAFTLPLVRGSFAGRSVLYGRIVHVADGQIEANEFPEGSEQARRLGFRALLCVPLIREGVAIGVITLRDTEVRLFTDRQVALLQTFAHQAVIAIENVRLFTELQTSNRELTTALDTQTATSDILRVISRSQTDVQLVFDAIVASAVRLLRGNASTLTRRVADELELAAFTSTGATGDTAHRARFPLPLDSEEDHGQVIRNRAPFNSADAHGDPRLPAAQQASARLRGYRSVVVVPLLHQEEAVGTLGVSRGEPGGFADAEIALLQTFAEQAVIAIENVRLFIELQQKNRALTDALDQQTATGEILRVISSSPTDVQPVFDAIVSNAKRLLDGFSAMVTRLVGDELYLAAYTTTGDAGDAILKARFPRPLADAPLPAQAVRERTVCIVTDTETDERFRPDRGVARARGYRSMLTVPLLHEHTAVGVINVTRAAPGSFSDDEIALLKTFADQAVIAIENVRLFRELDARTQDLTRSVSELRALNEVGQAISSTLDLQAVLSTIVARATNLSGTDAGVIYEYDEPREVFLPRASARLEAEIVETMLATPVRKGEGATGRLAETQEPVQVPDILAAPAQSRVRGALVRTGYRALLAVPLVREGHLLGGLTVIRKATGEFAPEVIELLRTFATQSALAIQNARLFQEIEVKSGQLAAASQHKSEFLANMSHELRTPLNAIIGYSELLEEEAGELDGGRLVPDLQKIAVAAKHQLSLINDILDLSKVEAGRMELELAHFDLSSAIDNALTLVRERAARRGITLERATDHRVGLIRGDERKVKQVLLNLLSNALKFTPEGGRIDVGAVMSADLAEVSVADTGAGIAPEDQEAVFEEFRQVGTADKKVEGTGLGLALSRKFIELHGGRIWVQSQVGHGSTFTFTLPVRREE